MPRKSILRLSRVIKEKAAHVLLHEIKDPRLGFITVTRVDLSDDMSFATVHYSVIGEDVQKRLTAHALEAARGYVQRRVADNLRTRIAPRLSFEYDDAIEGQLRMSQLLQGLRDERVEHGDDGDDGDDEDESAAVPGPESGTS